MKTSSAWFIRSIVSKIVMVLVLASMIGSVDMASAIGKDDRMEKSDRTEKHDKGNDQQKGHVNRYGYGGAFYFPKQPPIIYVPPPPRGMGNFFPPVYFNSFDNFDNTPGGN